MADSKINGFGTLTTAQADDNTRLLPSGNASTGVLSSLTVAQAKMIYSTQQLIYTATGSEGTYLVQAVLAARFILMIAREGSVLYPVVSAPDTASYTWDFTTITFGLALNAGERLLILYKNA